MTFESNSTPTPRKARLARIQRSGFNMQQFASSEGIVGDQLTKLGLVGTSHGAHFHAIREDEERRHRLEEKQDRGKGGGYVKRGNVVGMKG